MIRGISARRDERTYENERSRKCLRDANTLTFGRLVKIKKIKIIRVNITVERPS